MSRKQNRTRLSVQSLENRTVPTLWTNIVAIDWNNLPVFELVPEHQTGSIAFENGVFTATGTGLDDVIKVTLEQPVLTQYAFGYPIDVGGFLNDRVQVSIQDTAGNVRTDYSGRPLELSFPANEVVHVSVRARGGNDLVINRTATKTDPEGGDGNDTLVGGSGIDSLSGNAGNDLLLGGLGADLLVGGTGDNILRGEAGDDVLEGGATNDVLFGGDGDDSVLAGAGTDTLFGEAGDDELRGEDGNDIIFGGDGNDVLYGSFGNDSLNGDNGNDGLFGGVGKDTLRGGAGSDRFLRWTKTGNSVTLKDKAGSESLTTFKNTTTQQTATVNGTKLRYAPGEWTMSQIEAIDAGLGWLHAEVGNTRMLKRKDGSDMTFQKWGPYVPYNATDGVNDVADAQANAAGGGFTGFNRNNGTVAVVRLDTTNPDSTIRLVVHELAHNWDNENSKWSNWLALSGWVKTRTAGPGQTLSRDGNWVHNDTAVFARDYGRTNPMEDFATAFEALYQLKTGTLSVTQQTLLADKLNFLGLFITSLG